MAMQSSLALLTVSLFLPAGCYYESIDLGYHRPGHYVGKPDPLLNQAATPEHTRQLQERFASVQTDR